MVFGRGTEYCLGARDEELVTSRQLLEESLRRETAKKDARAQAQASSVPYEPGTYSA